MSCRRTFLYASPFRFPTSNCCDVLVCARSVEELPQQFEAAMASVMPRTTALFEQLPGGSLYSADSETSPEQVTKENHSASLL